MYFIDEQTKKLLLKIKKYDEKTYIHSVQTACITNYFLKYLKIEDRDIYIGALLHDIGKLYIPLNILNKKGSLTEDEYPIIKKHVLFGHEILSKYNYNEKIKDICLHHHERVDGEGYLEITDIAYTTKIITLVDSFDVMYHGRFYQRSKNIYEIINDIGGNANKQFDKELSNSFIQFLKYIYCLEGKK